MALKTLSIKNMEEKTSDIFEAVVIMSKRAKQILNNRIVEEIITSADEEELEMGVYDQIEEKNPWLKICSLKEAKWIFLL